MSANFIRKLSPLLTPAFFRVLANLYPPFLFAGIRITRIAKDFSSLEVKLYSYVLNMNYVGTHFGGSLYSMTDPWFMLILIQKLGRGFIVWDKGARIDFKKPGLGSLTATFQFSEEEISSVRAKVLAEGKYVFEKRVEVKNDQGEIVTLVDKILYVKRKDDFSPANRARVPASP